MARELDLLLRRATVYDGAGGPPRVATVGVADGRIVLLGDAEGAAARESLDCAGLALAPGFIDLHGHSDHLLLGAPHAESKLLQGVTTEVGGNCGDSPGPLVEAVRAEAEVALAAFGRGVTWRTLGEFLEQLAQHGTGPNFACMVGHGNVRAATVGYEHRSASAAEIGAMQSLAAAALRDGAFGVSSGLVYPPGMAADVAELATICRPAGAAGGFYATHLRNEGAQLLAAVEEALEIGRRAGCPVHLSHHKVCGEANWGMVEQSLALIDAARADGVDVTADQYPYTATSTGLYVFLPDWAQEGGAEPTAERMGDATARRRATAELAARRAPNWEMIRIAQVQHDDLRWCEGLAVAEVAHRMQLSAAEAVIELVVRERGHVLIVGFAMCEDDVERVMRHPAVMVGSDAAARATSGPLAAGKPHPRAFGAFPRVLGHYVRERKVLGLGEALRKMTSMPARRLGLADRGAIAAGAWADLVLFDPETIADRATYDDPLQPPIGIKGVWVNGQAVARDGELTGALPGRVLRGPGYVG